jgi:hypothetical protein
MSVRKSRSWDCEYWLMFEGYNILSHTYYLIDTMNSYPGENILLLFITAMPATMLKC